MAAARLGTLPTAAAPHAVKAALRGRCWSARLVCPQRSLSGGGALLHPSTLSRRCSRIRFTPEEECSGYALAISALAQPLGGASHCARGGLGASPVGVGDRGACGQAGVAPCAVSPQKRSTRSHEAEAQVRVHVDVVRLTATAEDAQVPGRRRGCLGGGHRVRQLHGAATQVDGGHGVAHVVAQVAQQIVGGHPLESALVRAVHDADAGAQELEGILGQ